MTEETKAALLALLQKAYEEEAALREPGDEDEARQAVLSAVHEASELWF